MYDHFEDVVCGAVEVDTDRCVLLSPPIDINERSLNLEIQLHTY